MNADMSSYIKRKKKHFLYNWLKEMCTGRWIKDRKSLMNPFTRQDINTVILDP